VDFDPVIVSAVVETPAVVIDYVRLRHNIDRMAELAQSGSVSLCPHIKTHKSLKIAELQMNAGATGVTASKSTEAEVFACAGIPSITVAYPLIDRTKIDRLLDCMDDNQTRVQFVIDSKAGLKALIESAKSVKQAPSAFVEVDVGLNRCGVNPLSDEALRLVRLLDSSPHIEFSGILSHAGQGYRAQSVDELQSIADTERRLMTEFADRLRKDGIAVPVVSVGSTPTVVRNAGFEGIDEIRPGNYVFMDRTQVALGVAQPKDVAFWIVATVVSVNTRFAIIDAGSKVLSSDVGPHGSSAVQGYGAAYLANASEEPPLTITGLSEEHGFLDHQGRPPMIGTRVAIMPNHSCPAANLAKEYLVINGQSKELWQVDARGPVR
jgi:D-serine deaminase-like pyridoxal phosphate-dependent protein